MQKLCPLYLDTYDSGETSSGMWRIDDTTIQSNREMKLTLLSVDIPNAVYPFNAYNNSLAWTQGGAAKSATITPNDYTGDSLAAHLQTIMRAVAGGIATLTVTWDPDLRKFTFTTFGGVTVAISASQESAYMLGFTADQSSSTSLVSDSPANLIYPLYLNLETTLPVHTYSTGINNAILGQIPMSQCPFGSRLYYEPAVSVPIVINSNFLQHIRIKFTDPRNRIWISPLNHYINIQILLEYINLN
jgi:hypothetical protein